MAFEMVDLLKKHYLVKNMYLDSNFLNKLFISIKTFTLFE